MSRSNVSCPGCKREFEVELPDYPTPDEIAKAIPQVDLANLQKQLEAAGTARVELALWQSGKNHNTFDPQHTESCPHCKSALDEYMQNQIEALPQDRVRELARKYGDWPPKSIALGDVTSSKARR